VAFPLAAPAGERRGEENAEPGNTMAASVMSPPDARQQRRRDREAEGFAGLEVDDQLVRGGLLDGQIGRLDPFVELVD